MKAILYLLVVAMAISVWVSVVSNHGGAGARHDGYSQSLAVAYGVGN